MKSFSRILVLPILISVMSLTSCNKSKDKGCTSGSGTLKLTNSSHGTVQRIMIDGVNYGSLDPGESKDISLAAGQHDWQLQGISGGTGCSSAKVTIVECQTTSFQCGA